MNKFLAFLLNPKDSTFHCCIVSSGTVVQNHKVVPTISFQAFEKAIKVSFRVEVCCVNGLPIRETKGSPAWVIPLNLSFTAARALLKSSYVPVFEGIMTPHNLSFCSVHLFSWVFWIVWWTAPLARRMAVWCSRTGIGKWHQSSFDAQFQFFHWVVLHPDTLSALVSLANSNCSCW